MTRQVSVSLIIGDNKDNVGMIEGRYWSWRKENRCDDKPEFD